MIKINLGSGIVLKSGYINVDSMFSLEDLKNGSGIKGNLYESAKIEEGAEFVQSDILKLKFEDNYADVIEGHQVIEHFRIRDVIPALKEMHRVLKPGGKLILTCPNFNNLCLQWINMRLQPSNEFDWETYLHHAEEFYGYQATEGEHHRNPMTPEWLKWCMEQSGFEGCEGKVVIFPINSIIPTEGCGLLSEQAKEYPSKPYFRTETIFMEVIKK